MNYISGPSKQQLDELVILSKQGNRKQAILRANILVNQFPNSYVLQHFIGSMHSQLNAYEDALIAYRKAIKLNPDYAPSHFNLAVALQALTRTNDAINSYQRAIELKRDYAQAHLNLAVLLEEKGERHRSIESYKKAIAIKPDYAQEFNNIGVELQKKGMYVEAIECYEKATRLKPKFALAHYNMGDILMQINRNDDALYSYKKAIMLQPNYADRSSNLSIAFRNIKFSNPDREMQFFIKSLLDRKTTIVPSDISGAAISLLEYEPIILKLSKDKSSAEISQNLKGVILELYKIPILIELLKSCPIHSLSLEKILKNIRSRILLSISKIKLSSEILIFQSALAIQCFNNEYIYDCSEIELNAIEVLVNLVNGKLNNGEQPSSQYILCLASYMSLYDYNFSKRIDCTPEIQEVFNQQIEDKEKEITLKKKIPVLEEITNKISSKVRSQYENNPYPRWITSAHKANPKTISDIVNSLKLNINNSSIIDVNHPKILVAGCGTGQHSISTALRFANSEVLAVDLSLSSLAYAKRKTQELGIANISYMQADILDLNKLDEKFDLIECAGVLHHMDDPMAGWKILKNCLKDSGLMKIALYSELARLDIIKMREEINKLRIEASDIGMKLYRNKIINSDSDHHKLISISQDFYSMSALRDLLFHTQEHRFTIPQIKSSIRDLGLKFMGFEDHINVSNLQVNNTEVGDLYDLDKWNIYEEANPAAFISMYQFWCQNSAR